MDLVVYKADLLGYHAGELVLSLEFLLALVDDLLLNLLVLIYVGLHVANGLNWPLDHGLLVLKLSKSDVLAVRIELLRLLIELLNRLVCQVRRIVVCRVTDHALLLVHRLVLLLEILLLHQNLGDSALADIFGLLKSLLLHLEVLLELLLILLLLNYSVLIVDSALLAKGGLGCRGLGSVLTRVLRIDVSPLMEHHALRGVHNLRSCSHWLHLTRTGVVSLHLVMGVVLSNRNRLVALDSLHRLLEVVV